MPFATFLTEFETAAGTGPAAPWLALTFFAAAALLLVTVPPYRRRVVTSMLLAVLAVGCLAIAAAVANHGGVDSTPYRWARFTGLLLLTVATVNVAGVFLFDLVLSSLRLRPPAIVSDLLVAAAYVAAALSLLSIIGVNLTGIVATSAVVTAVVGFSLQDTLGNVMGGMAVQLDRSIHVGDWIRVGDNEGRVVQIRWRHTAIETRNWDTILIPNGTLSKATVTVLGRRGGRPAPHRQWVYFNVDFRHAPTAVVDAVESALRSQAIPNVTADPAPNCVMMDFKDSYGSYAVRYWLTDLAPNDAASSAVRAVVFAALNRAGITPSIPAQSIFVTEDDASRRDRKDGEELARRVDTLRGIDLFSPLNDEERRELAGRLRHAPFVRGETIVRQGAPGDWLYILARGQAEVRAASDDGNNHRAVARLNPGDIFGEMGLMTGGPRTATVTALTDVACYRLDKHDLVDILLRRPILAEGMAQILAHRRTELDAVKEHLNEEAFRERTRKDQHDLVQRIRRFFTLDASASPPR